MKKLLTTLACLATLTVFAKTSAVIEQWDTHMVLSSKSKLTITEFLRVTIKDEDGYSFAVFRNYYDAFRRITGLKYTIYDASGKRIKKLGKADALDIMFNPSYEVDDARMLVLDPEYRNFPFTVEIEVEIDYNSYIGFPTWMPREAPDVEVKKATLTLECPDTYQFSTRTFNGVAAPEVSIQEGIKKSVWSVENLPAVNKQISYKAFEADQPKVHLTPIEFTLDKSPGSFTSWKTFGNWYLELNQNRNELSDETKAYLKGLDNTDKAGLVKAVYQYMQSRTRYVSIQLGIGGYQSLPASLVDTKGYGDCKALSNYTKSMLGYLGINANYVLIRAGQDAPDIISDFPSNQFNHVFLAVPLDKDTLWLECTSQILPPSYIGTFTDDRHALWLEWNGSDVIHTPVYRESENVKRNICQAKITDQGNAEIAMTIQQRGIFFRDLMLYKSGAQGHIEEVNYSKFNHKDFTIRSFNYEVGTKTTPQVDLTFEMTVNSLVKRAGPRWIFPMSMFQPIDLEVEMDLTNRKTEIRRGFTLEDDVVITMPENFRIDILPEAAHEKSSFGTAELTFEATDSNTLRVHRKVILYKGTYEGDTFEKFYDSFRKVKALEQTRVVLNSRT